MLRNGGNMEEKYYNPLSDMSRIKDSLMALMADSSDITGLIMPVLDDADLTLPQNWYGGTFDKDVSGQAHTVTLRGHCFDTPYIEGTLTDKGCAVYIETGLTKASNERIHEVCVNITVLCHRDLIRLSGADSEYYNSIGIYGNRVDGAVQLIHSAIQSSEIRERFSIGRLNLSEENPITSCDPLPEFHGKCLSYKYKTFYR